MHDIRILRRPALGLMIVLIAAPALAQWRPDPVTATAEAAIGRFGPADRTRANCTAALIAPDTLLTAAHCIGKPTAAGTWRAVAPVFGPVFGPVFATTGTAATWLKHRPLPGPEQASDAALVTLANPATATPLPLTTPRPPEAMIAIGYPRALGGRRQRLNCNALEQQGNILLLDCPVTSGMSGAPVLARRGGTWHIAAVLVASLGSGAARAMAIVPAPDGFAPPPWRIAAEPGFSAVQIAP